MPIAIHADSATVVIRKASYEKRDLNRHELDSRFNLTDEEFRVEGDLVAIGPLPSEDLIGPIVDYLEEKGLVYFDDFFELSGNWPQWLSVHVMQQQDR